MRFQRQRRRVAETAGDDTGEIADLNDRTWPWEAPGTRGEGPSELAKGANGWWKWAS